MTPAKELKPTLRRCRCGYQKVYPSQALAAYHFPKHSCVREQERQARQRRVAERAASRGGVKRDCQHKVASHRHGTRTAYVLDRCRCVPCLDAAREYENRRVRQHMYGRWNHRVDAGPSRQRLLDLAAQGVGYKQVARATGLNPSTVSTLLYGRPGRRDHRPPRTVSAEFERALLSWTPDPMQLSDGHRIDSTGTRRRLQALIRIGWSQRKLAAALGMTDQNFSKVLLVQQGVTVKRAREVRELYERLWDASPPARTAAEKRGVTMAKRKGVRLDWLPPMAWPDESIDDPEYDPGAVADESVVDELAIDLAVEGRGVPLSHQERLLAVARLTAAGKSAREIAERIGVTKRQVVRDRGEMKEQPA